jgi:hypothetical protein
MAELDPEELVVGLNGNVYVAPFGTALPTTEASALNAAFYNVGLLTEDGVTQNDARERQRFFAWQRSRAVRIVETSRTTTYTLAMEQWNGDNFTLAFGGGELVEISAGHYGFNPPSLAETDEFSIVVDWSDQGYTYRAVAERTFVSEDVEIKLTRQELAVLALGMEVLGSADDDAGWYLRTDNPAFAPVS